MPNKSRGKINQPPSGEGKKQSPYSGDAHKMDKRSTVLQAQRNHPEENISTSEDEMSSRSILDQAKNNPKRPKAGR